MGATQEGGKMDRKLSKMLFALGTVTVVAFMNLQQGCESGYADYNDCYDYYCGYDCDYCDYYYYDPYYPYYGYFPIYYITVPPTQYAHPNLSLPERSAEAVINVQNLFYVAKTGSATKSVLTPVDFEKHYPCGQGNDAVTVCADENAGSDANDRLMIMYKTEEPLPVDDPTNHFVIGFAFDADGVQNNNFVPKPELAGDYFGRTDKWYIATYGPGSGWKLEVFDASGSKPVAVASHARLVIHQKVVSIVIPASEFSVSNPAVRISLFRHTGDFGQGFDNDWSGLVYPKPGEPLIKPSVSSISNILSPSKERVR